MENTVFDHKKIEEKWQKRWQKEKTYQPDIEKDKNPFYNLWMFPYPSAEGLHAGHAFASTGSDIYGRFMRMNGHSVFQPIGYDSFGIHSENFAMKINQTPQEMLDRTTKNYEKQLRSLGHGYDWTRTVTTSEVSYYKWTQWLFVEMFKAGLAYKKKALVNFCPSCKTVLADEQTLQNENDSSQEENFRVCERCSTKVEKRKLNQWFFRITNYAERLLQGLNEIDWSQRVVSAQREWIGKKKGFVVKWKIKGSDDYEIETFTTRLDTVFGVTFLAIAPEHPIVNSFLSKNERIMNYVSKALSKSEQSRKVNEKEKTGVETNIFAVHPITKKEIPIWVADFVLFDYGTGAIMGVPAHDERDFGFATTNKIPIKQVVLCDRKDSNQEVSSGKLCYEGYGDLVNSDNYSGLNFKEAIEKISSDNPDSVQGKETYHLRDWLISRQRYWGPPIPMIHCQECEKNKKSWLTENKAALCQNQSDWNHWGWYPEEKLPIELPFLKEYHPSDDGKGPLAKQKNFSEIKCPYCKSKAERETDVSDTFVDSSWYFLRYPSTGLKTKNSEAFNDDVTKKWLPVNLYFGGAEHSVLHLIYARFMTMFLYDMKIVNFKEPFPKFFAHGLVIKDGAKMSKSKGNVVNPDEYIEKFGSDVLRLYLMFMGPMDGSPDFRDTGIEGTQRFVNRVWNLLINTDNLSLKNEKGIDEILSKTHQTIKKVTEDMHRFQYNTAISSIMELVNLVQKKTVKKAQDNKSFSEKNDWKSSLKALALLLAPFAPHLAEEAWVEIFKQKFSVHNYPWPNYDSSFFETDIISVVIQVNGKVRGLVKINKSDGKNKEKIKELAVKDEKIFKWLEGKKIKETFLVPDKLINFVIN